MYKPLLKIKGKIYPPACARAYWEERLSFKLNDCYNEIYKQVKPKLKDLLKDKKWTKCERMILESWDEDQD